MFSIQFTINNLHGLGGSIPAAAGFATAALDASDPGSGSTSA
jgi:hypothetical protein